MNWLQVQGSTSTVLIATVDFVLMLRVWILFGRCRWLVWFFGILATIEVVVMFVVDSLAFAEMKEYVHLGSIVKGCYAYNVPRFLTIFAAAPLLVTSIMFAMTLYRCVITFSNGDHRVMPIWKLFLRDGVVWFLAVFLAGGAELLIWTSRRQTLKQLLIVPSLVVYSIVSSRALLNMKGIIVRERAELRKDNTTNDSQPIVFASV
ncbi:hypothetical protein DFH09DRAFT_1126440 [Mycena vulgaris]|nr:hypothetical protein DFH09DRAFT_1126440 [Mycena vulgaris]